MIQITKIILTNFRNFPIKKIEFNNQLILFVGKNGVGKTNILESLTLLGRGQNLRSCDFEEIIFFNQNNAERKQQFTIYSEIKNHEIFEKMGTSFDLQKKKKIFQINDEILSNKRQGELRNQFINFICLTPQLEQLFILGKSQRRDYLDKIVSDIDFEHNSRVNSYQKLLRERLAILLKYGANKSGEKWLDAVENQIVELGTAIASARIEAIDFFNKAINSFASNFPKPKLIVKGDVEQSISKQSAVSLEENYKKTLEKNRGLDLENFKTNFGVHRSDFDAIFVEKNMSATLCSTGEQKAIMISITLARAKILSTYKNQPTILIFDEIVSHLDDKRKEDLFNEITTTNLQAFFSATSTDLIPQKFRENNLIEILEIF